MGSSVNHESLWVSVSFLLHENGSRLTSNSKNIWERDFIWIIKIKHPAENTTVENSAV